jgi:ferredoxin
MAMGAVREVYVDPDKCICHEWCVHVCPDVFEMDREHATARVREDASTFFESHALKIAQAVRECPVNAICISEA